MEDIILKLRETARKGECPEDVESRRCTLVSLIAVNECVYIIYECMCMYVAIL